MKSATLFLRIFDMDYLYTHVNLITFYTLITLVSLNIYFNKRNKRAFLLYVIFIVLTSTALNYSLKWVVQSSFKINVHATIYLACKFIYINAYFPRVVLTMICAMVIYRLYCATLKYPMRTAFYLLFKL